MTFYVLMKEEAYFFLERLDKSIREQIQKEIVSLKFNPIRKGKFFFSFGGVVYFEKRIFSGDGYRIYYTINDDSVVIASIEYEGTVNIPRIGNKKTQKKDAKVLRGLAKASKATRKRIAKLGGKAKKHKR